MKNTVTQYRAPSAFFDPDSEVYVAGILTADEIERIGKGRVAAMVDDAVVLEEEIVAMASEADLRRSGVVSESDIRVALAAGAKPDKGARRAAKKDRAARKTGRKAAKDAAHTLTSE